MEGTKEQRNATPGDQGTTKRNARGPRTTKRNASVAHSLRLTCRARGFSEQCIKTHGFCPCCLNKCLIVIPCKHEANTNLDPCIKNPGPFILEVNPLSLIRVLQFVRVFILQIFGPEHTYSIIPEMPKARSQGPSTKKGKFPSSI